MFHSMEVQSVPGAQVDILLEPMSLPPQALRPPAGPPPDRRWSVILGRLVCSWAVETMNKTLITIRTKAFMAWALKFYLEWDGYYP